MWGVVLSLNLPQALAAAPGDALGFERVFANPGSEAASFEVAFEGPGVGAAGAGAGAAAALSLVTDTLEWQALAPRAGLAGGSPGGLPSCSA